MNRVARRKLRAGLARVAEWGIEQGTIQATFRAPCGCVFGASGASRADALDNLTETVALELERRHAREAGA